MNGEVHSSTKECPSLNRYLGSYLSQDCAIDEELNSRINRGSEEFARIRKKVINNHDLRISIKSSVYRAVCLSVLLYGCESWSLYCIHVKRLEHFHIRYVRCILGITWLDRVHFTDMLSRAGLTSIECILHSTRMQYSSAVFRRTGHIIRMPDVRYLNRVYYG